MLKSLGESFEQIEDVAEPPYLMMREDDYFLAESLKVVQLLSTILIFMLQAHKIGQIILVHIQNLGS